ncbi:MAG: hypothetical protein E6Q34_03995 [Burkholderiaceae bacterium]|nr:MAG: hypothetical protein E6Q34_03995 [Burkholderiaceae bacterium]
MSISFPRLIRASLLSLGLVAASSQAQNNFMSTEAIQATCKLQESQKFKKAASVQGKQSQVICRDIALVKQIATWIEMMKVEPNKDFTSKDFDQLIRKELRHIRAELGANRQALEKLQIKNGEGLIVVPATWQFDLNGDGQITTWEKYFFAIVRPGERPFSLNMPSDDPQYYQQHFNLDARFRIDQSDVYWALAYHQFFEGFANLLLSFQIENNRGRSFRLKMIDQASLTKAHQLIGEGLTTSEKMRQSLLAETDDELEWIPNPRQINHVFPLAMDQESFDTWGKFLRSFTPLWKGQTLLVAPRNGGGLLGEAAKLCPDDSGVNVATLFQKAPPVFGSFKHLAYACTKVDAQHPSSDFVRLAQEAMEKAQRNPGSPEWHFVRYFYWVN